VEPGRGGDGARAGGNRPLARGAANGPQALAGRRPGLRGLGGRRPSREPPRPLRAAVGGDAAAGGGEGMT